ncbi:MAG: M15 family metallopeptidase [Clostridia bacterium]|nr:M15 family metallopeptidase [Clostridia bacterium]
MQISNWSKGRKILLGILGGVALSGLLVLLGYSFSRAVETVSESPFAPTERTEAAEAAVDTTPSVPTKSVSVQLVPATEAPAPVITFAEDKENPMPDEAMLSLGEPYPLGGTIYSNRKLTAVTVSISCAHNTQEPYPYRVSVRLSKNASGIYTLTDPADGGKSLAELVDFSKLLVGVHTMKIVASCEDLQSVEIYRCRFRVAGEEWLTIQQENFPDSYPEALAFFGSPERFLYRYQWVNGRYIMADPEWEEQYIVSVSGYPNGEPWLVHADAAPFFERAFRYLETAYCRVHGTNGDTGVISVGSLITEYNGCYVSRFTSSLKSISHHTFGTAVDVNASMEPNKNTADNKAVIAADVREHLTYNGLVTENDVTYYDFTYDGSYASDPNGVPETCVNYLLYELAFYRAGFEWAHYYKSTSDAMHFCLSEYVTYSHDDKAQGLRKVYVYCAPMELTKEQQAALPTASLPTATPRPEGGKNRPNR